MSIGGWIAVGILIWTIISVWHFISSIGDKFRKDKWYDYILFPPALALAYTIGFTIRGIKWVSEKKR